MTQTKAQERKYILLSHEEWAEKMKIEWGRQLERGGSKYESVWWNVSIIYEEQASSSWGDWHFDKKSLYLDLLPSHSSTNWTHEEPFYAIDLKDIDHAGDMLFWIYQLKGKNLKLYGENVVKDLIDAFEDVLQPHHKCRGGRKLDKGSELATKYRNKLYRQEKILNDPNRKIDLQEELPRWKNWGLKKN